MNYRLVIQQLGLLVLVLCGLQASIATGAGLLGWLADAPVEGTSLGAILISAGVAGLLGGLLWLFTRGASGHVGRREALLLVAVTWILGAGVAALPYYLWAQLDELGPSTRFSSVIDCYFEAMSGLTTTGATILEDIEVLPPSILFWRALTHWLGGLGIVVLFVAVLPSVGTGAKKLFQVESAGPKHSGVRPHIRDTARVLWLIYVGLTVAATLALWATGKMSFFDAVTHAFSMVSTGGLSARNASIGAYDSMSVDFICSFFMLLAAINFALYYQVTRGKWRTALRDVELRVYLILKVTVILFVAFNLWGTEIISLSGRVIEDATFIDSIRYSTFTTVSLQTGTGFCVADYNAWPYLSKTLLFGMMFIGGCAGSTVGGIKVVRFWIAIKVMIGELEKAYRPNVVRPIRLAGATIDPELRLSCVVYCIGFIIVGAIGAALVYLFEPAGGPCDGLTAISASAACLANVGPGLGAVGATANYGWMTPGSKLLLIGLMALGRLEFFALLVLFTPRFWRGD